MVWCRMEIADAKMSTMQISIIHILPKSRHTFIHFIRQEPNNLTFFENQLISLSRKRENVSVLIKKPTDIRLFIIFSFNYFSTNRAECFFTNFKAKKRLKDHCEYCIPV